MAKRYEREKEREHVEWSVFLCVREREIDRKSEKCGER
jgi:hypothetical protein